VTTCKFVPSRETLLVVVPTYQERDNITLLCHQIIEVVPSCTILVIDDGSPDGTGAVVAQIGTIYPQVELLNRGHRRGIGSAHKAAMAIAKARNFRVLVTLDADLTHNPQEIPNLLSALDTADLAIASRFLPGGGLTDWPVWRRLLTHLGHLATRLLLGIPFDATGAFRAYRVEALSNSMPLALSDDYSFFFQSAKWFSQSKLQIVEVPILLSARAFGSSKMKFSDVLRGLLNLALFSLTSKRRRRV